MIKCEESEFEFNSSHKIQIVFDNTNHIWINCMKCFSTNSKEQSSFESLIKDYRIHLFCNICDSGINYISFKERDNSMIKYSRGDILPTLTDEGIYFIHSLCDQPFSIKIDKQYPLEIYSEQYIYLKCSFCIGCKRWFKYRKVMSFKRTILCK